jgi:NAD(P)-dependent dehydrogenase (short-subunit alcohol dehydrogenase family)
MTARLQGAAIVTGGGRGIGRAIARGLATAGMQVTVVARTPAQVDETVAGIRDAGGVARGAIADVTDYAAVERLIAEAEDAFGGAELLVNAHGILEAVGPIWAVDPERWWRDVEVSLRGGMHTMRAVLPGMLDRGRGRIVNVSSVAGLSANPAGSGYTAAKMAMIRLTESVAASVSSTGVSVFAVDPGMVRTYLTEQLLAHESGDYRYLERAFAEWGVPPEETARLVVFLASGAADGLSGRFVSVSDDYEEVARRAREVVAEDLYQVRWRRFPGLRRLRWP